MLVASLGQLSRALSYCCANCLELPEKHRLLSVGKSPVHIVMHKTNREEKPKGAQKIPALTLQPRQEGDDRMHLDLIGLN
jgi:hypothetical protein